LVLGYRIMWDN